MAVAKSFDTIYRALKKGALAPVYYLTGSEDVLKDELVTLIIDQVLDPQSRDFNLDERTASDLNGESLHALIETPPMLAEHRVVVVKNLEQWRKNAKVWQVLDTYLEQPSPTTVLILTQGPGEQPHKTLEATTVHVVLDPLNPDRLIRWVGRRARQAGFEFSEEAAQHLIAAVDTDLSQLGMEIDKLAAAAPSGSVDVALVSDLVGVRRGETSQDWVGTVLARDIARSISMLETVLGGARTTAVRMVSALGTGLIGVCIARRQLDRGRSLRQAQETVFDALRAARPFGVRGWKEESASWTRAASNWTYGELSQAIRAAYDCDRALKSTTVSDEAGVLAQMALSMANLEVAA